MPFCSNIALTVNIFSFHYDSIHLFVTEFNYRYLAHAFLFQRRHHQIIFNKFNFQAFPIALYERQLWDYSEVNINLIHIDWKESMTNCIISVFTNFVPNKTIICKDKYCPWMDSYIKLSCQNKANIYKRYVTIGRNIADRHDNISSYCVNLVNDSKDEYIYNLSEKINDQHIGAKTY